MIEIKDLTKRFGGKIAVNNLNLTINDGEVFGLLGPNGAGKSTTIKMATGILNPTSGDVAHNGYSIVKDTLNAKRQFGLVLDNPDMFLGMTGLGYLSFICSIYGIDETLAMSRCKDLAKKFEIYNELNNYILNYSHGMRQKIFLIGSLIHDPNNWILDEPLTGLDPEAAKIVKDMMLEHAKNNKTVLFSTHVLDVAEKVCDRIGIIFKGKLIFIGTINQLRQKQNEKDSSLENLFLELTSNNETVL